MIHTMTIQHEIPTEAVRRLLSTAGRSGDEIEAFVYGLENPRKKKVESTTYIRRPYPGIHEQLYYPFYYRCLFRRLAADSMDHGT